MKIVPLMSVLALRRKLGFWKHVIRKVKNLPADKALVIDVPELYRTSKDLRKPLYAQAKKAGVPISCVVEGKTAYIWKAVNRAMKDS